jgi:hypothetical protein
MNRRQTQPEQSVDEEHSYSPECAPDASAVGDANAGHDICDDTPKRSTIDAESNESRQN